jgi:hypothetical protein
MLEAHNENTPIRVSHDLLHSDFSQTLTEVLIWTIKDALDLVSVGLTHNTSTYVSAEANVLLVLNDQKIKEHAKLNGKIGGSHVIKNGPCSRQPWREHWDHYIHGFSSWTATSASPNKKMSSNRDR